MNILARRVGGANGRAGGHPGRAGVVHLASEGISDQGAGASEEAVFVLGLTRWAGGVGVVHVADHGGEGDAAILEALLNTGSGDGGLVVSRDSVVVCVNGLDEIGVELLVEEIDVGVFNGKGELLRDDRLAEVHVDETGGGKLGLALGEGGCEGTLVMIIAVDGGVVHTTDIHDSVAFLELGGVASTDEGGGGVGGEQAEEVDGQGLVGVEVAAELVSREAEILATELTCESRSRGRRS